MPISLDVGDAEGGDDREVLQQGDRADVGEVFAADLTPLRAVGPVPLLDEAGVDQALEHALAVLVARAGVAEMERHGQTLQRGVGFVDDKRRAVRPLVQKKGDLGRERHVPVQRLLDKQQPLEKRRDAGIAPELVPEGAEPSERSAALVAVQAEGPVAPGVRRDHPEDPP